MKCHIFSNRVPSILKDFKIWNLRNLEIIIP